MKNKLFSAFLVIMLLFSVLSPLSDVRVNAASTEKIPTIVVHGFKGGSGTFKTMTEFYKNQLWLQNYGELTMSKDGKKVTGSLKRVDVAGPGDDSISYTRPLVNLIFENNDGSLKQQVEWFKAMVKYTKNYYGATKINIIAHSMGGLVATKYILDTGGKDVVKLVTLDSPIQGSPTGTAGSMSVYGLLYGKKAIVDLSYLSSEIKNIQKQKSKFNKNIKVMSFSATKESTVVTDKSAWGLSEFTKNISLYSIKDSHSGIHENYPVLQEVQKFIYK